MNLRILHLSSPQVSVSNESTLRHRILAMIKTLRKNSLKPDMIFFSGNLSSSAQEGEFALFEEVMVKPLKDEFDLGNIHVIMVPGLTDIQDDSINRIFQKGLRSELKGEGNSAEIWLTDTYKNEALLRLANYSNFLEKYRYSEVGSIPFSGKLISVIGLNSVFACNRTSDYEGFITLGQFDETRSRVRKETADLSIGCWHHPLEELDNGDRNRLKSRLEQTFDICITSSGRNGNEILESSHRNMLPGRAFGGGNGAGCTFIEIDILARTGTAMSLVWNQRSLDFEVQSQENGSSKLILSPRITLEPRAIATQEQLRSIGYRTSIERLERHLPTIQTGKLQLSVEDRFLEPYLITLNEGREKPVKIQDIVREQRNFIIAGLVQSGKSALLDFLEAKISGTAQVAFRINYLDIDDLHARRKGLLDLLVSKSGFSRRRLQQILAADITLLIDNAILRYEEARWLIINSWCEDISHLKIIVAGRQNVVSESAEKLSSRWTLCDLKPLSIKKVKHEVSRLEKHLGDGKKVTSLSAFVETLIQAELPRWPWVILILFELARNAKLIEINSMAMLVQRYVELRLRNVEVLDTSSPSKLLARMLHLVSECMMKNRVDFMYRSDVIEIMQSELNKCGISDNSDRLLDLLLDSKLIFIAAGKISFAFFVLQEYFFSEYMRENSIDVSDIDADNLIRYGGALALLSEKVVLPGLLLRSFALAEKYSPNEKYTISLEDLSALEQTLSNLSANDTLERARQTAERSAQNLENSITAREKHNSGTKLRRLQSGAMELSRLLNFSQLLCVSTAILRSSTFVDFSIKKKTIERALNLSVSYIAEFLYNKQLTEYVISTLNVEMEPRLRRNVAAVFSVLLVIAVGYMLANQGAGRHLLLAISEVFHSEEDDFRRLILIMWHYSIEQNDLEIMVSDFLRKSKKKISLIKILETWLNVEYIKSATFENLNLDELERTYKMVIEERIRVTSPNYFQSFDQTKQKKPAATIKADTSKELSMIKRIRNAQMTISHEIDKSDDWRILNYYSEISSASLSELSAPVRDSHTENRSIAMKELQSDDNDNREEDDCRCAFEGRPPINLLFVAGDRGGVQRNQIAIPREWDNIQKAVRASEQRDNIALASPILGATRQKLIEAYRVRPAIIHFAGHGDERGLSILVDQGLLVNQSSMIGTQLASILASFPRRVALVVLNVCESVEIAKELVTAHAVGAAIGWPAKVTDEAAIGFSESLYGRLGDGLSLPLSAKLATESYGSETKPVLHLCPNLAPDAFKFFERTKK